MAVTARLLVDVTEVRVTEPDPVSVTLLPALTRAATRLPELVARLIEIGGAYPGDVQSGDLIFQSGRRHAVCVGDVDAVCRAGGHVAGVDDNGADSVEPPAANVTLVAWTAVEVPSVVITLPFRLSRVTNPLALASLTNWLMLRSPPFWTPMLPLAETASSIVRAEAELLLRNRSVAATSGQG